MVMSHGGGHARAGRGAIPVFLLSEWQRAALPPSCPGPHHPDASLTRHRQCYKGDGSSKSPDCPVCSRSLNQLAQPLPMAHCANSRLVCKISGDVMNENNPPMMLPNGHVYGYNVRPPGGRRAGRGGCQGLGSSSYRWRLSPQPRGEGLCLQEPHSELPWP